MLDNALSILKQYCKNKKVAIAVSGGADSMAMLYYVLGSNIVDKKNLFVVSVNHNIRGETSSRDSDFVKAKCNELQLELTALNVDVPHRCALSGRSIELEAREARRELFTDLVNTAVADVVILAHHAQDNAETILMRALRGTGISGLAGMKIYDENSGILRPFLTTEKSEILDYVRQNNIDFVTDETNFDDSYDRNFIRLKLMPLIQTRYNGAQKALNRLGVLAAQTNSIIKDLLDESNFVLDGDCIKIKLDAFKTQALGSAYVATAIKKLGVTEDVYSKNIDEVLGLLKLDNGAKVCVGQGYTAIKEYDYITIGKFDKIDIGQNAQQVVVKLGVNIFDNLSISITQVDSIKASECKNKLQQGDKSELLFDFSKLPVGAVIRYRNSGDVFEQFGGGTKKLKEYLINKKIPARMRDKIPLICYNNKVLIILGQEISDSVRCDKNCQSCCVVSILQ